MTECGQRSSSDDRREGDALLYSLEGLPDDAASSLQQDGSRRVLHPADVRGRFTRYRYVAFALLIIVYAILPWIKIDGRPALFLDIQHRRFFILGGVFNSQDFWLVFFLLTGLVFLLVVVTTLFGRIWCGFGCPQTVFLEGVYRRIERLIEGARPRRIRRDQGTWNLDKIWRKTLKQVLFALCSLIIAHIFLSYFVSLPALFDMMVHHPSQHPEAFAWAMGVAAALHINFAWFREQTCLVVCPYGRLQSLLTDQDSWVVGYDQHRGEPRGKLRKEGAGDCIDCHRCVAVCPTGIDIRNGLQMECVGCAACIDACDEIMDRVGRPRGLVRYDSLNGLAGQTRRFFRPRLIAYVVLGLVGTSALAFALSRHEPFEANILRMAGAPPFVIDEGVVRNAFVVHLVNKHADTRTFEIVSVEPEESIQFAIAMPEVTLGSLEGRSIPVFVTQPLARVKRDHQIQIRISVKGVQDASRLLTAPFLGPREKGGP